MFSIADMTLGACLCLAPGRDTGLCFGETDCSRSEKRGRKLIIIFERSKFCIVMRFFYRLERKKYYSGQTNWNSLNNEVYILCPKM